EEQRGGAAGERPGTPWPPHPDPLPRGGEGNRKRRLAAQGGAGVQPEQGGQEQGGREEIEGVHRPAEARGRGVQRAAQGGGREGEQVRGVERRAAATAVPLDPQPPPEVLD